LMEKKGWFRCRRIDFVGEGLILSEKTASSSEWWRRSWVNDGEWMESEWRVRNDGVNGEWVNDGEWMDGEWWRVRYDGERWRMMEKTVSEKKMEWTTYEIFSAKMNFFSFFSWKTYNSILIKALSKGIRLIAFARKALLKASLRINLYDIIALC
jgi:hypothetical protein